MIALAVAGCASLAASVNLSALHRKESPRPMEIAGHVIGVCSWSLHPKDVADLLAQVKRLELSHVQIGLAWLLALNDARREDEIQALRDNGVEFTAGMISFPGEDYSSISIIKQTGGFVPDQFWPQRRELSFRAAELAQKLG